MKTSYALGIIIAALICKTLAQIPNDAPQHLPCPSPYPYPPPCKDSSYRIHSSPYKGVTCDMLHISLSPPSSCAYDVCYVSIPIPGQTCPYIVYGYNCKSGNHPNGCTITNTCRSTYKCVQRPGTSLYEIPYCEC
uniref:uncharacterized protein LOC120346687 n=1 Tax=Styela clava TaxID=7725 RepID=UPI001939DE7C|nr:uncharacterized protein LOC120346687 [Styela clava]